MEPISSEKLIQIIQEIVAQLTGFMKLDCQVNVTEEMKESGRSVTVAVYAPENARFLIGKDGQNLRAMEHLVRALVGKKTGPGIGITLDINDYRRSKALEVIELARQAVSRVRDSHKAEALAPMTAYERRVVHMELATHTDLATESIGEEPLRRVVIKPRL